MSDILKLNVIDFVNGCPTTLGLILIMEYNFIKYGTNFFAVEEFGFIYH